MKCVIVVDKTLPLGLLANTAAALGLSLGSHAEGLIGPEPEDKSGVRHRGITAVPIPVLSADRETIGELYRKGQDAGESLLTLGFDTATQKCHKYSEYMEQIAETFTEDIEYQGVCLYGPKKRINRLCGQLSLLK